MTHWQHYNPVHITAGAGQFKQLAQHLAPGHWLLVTTAGTTRRGVTEQLQQALGATHTLSVCDEITPNPELQHLQKLTDRYRETSFVGIIGLGGGSALDAAKVLSVTLADTTKTPLAQALQQASQPWTRRVPVVAIPTTSGTGAEVTPFATVWDQTAHKKHSVSGDLVYPKLALLDPTLTLSLPPTDTLYTALDATSHALESLWNINRTPISAACAKQALRLIVAALPIVQEHPSDLEGRSQMQQASMLVGLAISQTRTVIAHSISYPLTSHYGVPHGLACSFTLPAIIEQYLEQGVNEQEAQLLRQLIQLLDAQDLKSHLYRYTDQRGVERLLSEMTTPDRAGNFSLPHDAKAVIGAVWSQ